jgi:3-keto-5-aminohexanoate cleavage enzyme
VTALLPYVIAVAPNGARRTKADHAAIPLTPAEIAREAAACADAGATVLHLHVRDAAGGHSLDAALYEAAIASVRREAGDRLVVQATTEQAGRYAPADQMRLLRALRPEAASISLAEILPEGADEAEIAGFFRWAEGERIALQYILYSAAEAQRLVALQRRGIIAEERPNALFVLGRYTAGQRSDPTDLLPFLAGWPADWKWSVCAFGAAEARCMAAAIALGGHARVGFENNTVLPDGRVAASNAELVAEVARLAPLIGRPVASIAAARAIYGVAPAR